MLGLDYRKSCNDAMVRTLSSVTSMALMINTLHKFLTTTRQIDNIKFSDISYSQETRIVIIKNKSQLIPEYTFF